MVRRLAKQSRGDRVLSRRDYQTILTRNGLSFDLNPDRSSLLVFKVDAPSLGNVPFLGVGGYCSCDRDADVTFTITLPSGRKESRTIHCATQWSRVGFAVPSDEAGTIRLETAAARGTKVVSFWGLSCGPLSLPQIVLDQGAAHLELLNSDLSPEGLYLPHDEALEVDSLEEERLHAREREGLGPEISLKKCAYCQRLLPIDLNRPSALAFHKHNAKATGHQNECRACKKWRINNNFNPKRTTDQLHESSVITRERKQFLREPGILVQIKDRQGTGLKSIVWERFGKKCFRCGKAVDLSDVQLDHTRPMAYLWPIDSHATCLCADCNNHKKDRFPVDVYSGDELKRLSGITGLSVEDLSKKEINQVELDRILGDIEAFAKQWDPRMFNATARKIRELKQDVDLFEILTKKNADLHSQILDFLSQRPEGELEEAATAEK
jgi:hypothetical protein